MSAFTAPDGRDALVRASPLPDGGPSLARTLGEAATPLTVLRLPLAVRGLSRAPRGDGHVVVDVPGLGAPEASGWPIRRFLRRAGYDARGWGLGRNRGAVADDLPLLLARVEELAEGHGPVSLLGWSLGGVLSREVARRRPDLVRRVLTYGTPVVGGPAHTVFARSYGPDVAERAASRAHQAETDRPVRVPVTAFFSRRDGIVAWQACLDRYSPDVEHVEVRSTHLGMGLDPAVWTVVADRLARPVAPGAGEGTSAPHGRDR